MSLRGSSVSVPWRIGRSKRPRASAPGSAVTIAVHFALSNRSPAAHADSTVTISDLKCEVEAASGRVLGRATTRRSNGADRPAVDDELCAVDRGGAVGGEIGDQVQLGKPVFVGQGDEATSRRGRTTDDMSEDIDPAQPLERFPGQRRAAVRRGQVRLDVVDAIDPILDGPRGRDDPCAAGQEALDGRAAEALGSPADKHTLAGEFRLDGTVRQLEAVGEAERTAREVTVRGTFDDDGAALFADTVGREDRLHRDHVVFEQLPNCRPSFEPLAVINDDGVGLEGRQHAVDIKAGVRLDIIGDGAG
ncbi:hypothetical protein WR25_05083 [Diploscapter pachys]|uniref:Uncharacterized protein n=1 Tax=Diploscapter pachys TaxID=2018661 RepID=A0A2A2K787_9BILA|nr:hypothetical protein WR25_05083 [Diploscapter pachys]